jgi:hypothetical protein
MTLNSIEPAEIPEYFVTGCLTYFRSTADAVGQTVLLAAGKHPKLRITRADVFVIAYSTAADVFAIEEQGGTDHGTVTAGAVAGLKTAFSITDDIFEANEAVCINLTTDGNALNAAIISIYFESIH